MDQDPKNENAKILADKLKSEKNISSLFQCLKYTHQGTTANDITCACVIENINFTKNHESSFFQPYDIIEFPVGEAGLITIFLENTATPFNGAKIGKLADGTNSLSEFNSTVMERFDKDGGLFKETLILAYSEEAIEEVKDKIEDKIEDKSKIGLVIGLLFGGTLLAGGLYLLLSRCL